MTGKERTITERESRGKNDGNNNGKGGIEWVIRKIIKYAMCV